MPNSPMRMFYISDIESVFWTVVILAAALLLRRFRGVPAILVLIGAVAMLGQSLIISVTIHHPALDRMLDAHPDAFNVVHDLLMRYVSFCFPVGLLWLSWRIRRTAPNHAMERTADRLGSRLKEELRIMKQATRAPASRRSSCSR